jgi:hypothetical protein
MEIHLTIQNLPIKNAPNKKERRVVISGKTWQAKKSREKYLLRKSTASQKGI